ncbi:MAG: hypothetical protein KJ935_00145 [Candidatus Omnitrophica bacterium]|nr:hypothetical protein [Candidatus Omnitrophota bacterium]
MKKRNRTFLLTLAVLVGMTAFFFGYYLPELSGNYLAWRVKSGSKGKIQLLNPVFHSGPGLTVEEIVFTDWSKPPFSFSVTDVTVQNLASNPGFKPVLIALAGKGKVGSANPKQLKINGRITGNFRTGSYEVSNLKVRIEKVGEISVSGRIETRGTESSRISINLADVSLAELKKSLGLKTLPTQGSLQGQVVLAMARPDGQWKAQRLDGRVIFSGLRFEEQKISPLSGEAQGFYDFAAGSGQINSARILTQSGGSLSLTGNITQKGFDLSFTSDGFYLEDLIEALPAPVREKMGLKMEKVVGKATYDSENGTLSSHVSFSFYKAAGGGDFSVQRSENGKPSIFGHLNLSGLDLLSLSTIYGNGAQMSGIANLGYNFQTGESGLESWRALFETVPVKGVRQYLNVRALKVLLAISAGSPVGFLARNDYGYRKLKAAVTYRDGLLSIEGLARREKGRDYILLGNLLGYTVNISMDPKGNTIKLDDLKQRLNQVFSN